MTNACAGPWDVIAAATNTTKVNGTYSTTRGEPFTARAAFSLYRGSRVTTNASPEPLRRGGTVTRLGAADPADARLEPALDERDREALRGLRG